MVGPLFVQTQAPNTCPREIIQSARSSPYQYLDLDGVERDNFRSPTFMIGILFTLGLSPVAEHMGKRTHEIERQRTICLSFLGPANRDLVWPPARWPQRYATHIGRLV